MISIRRALMVRQAGTPAGNPEIVIAHAFNNSFNAKSEVDARMSFKGYVENGKAIILKSTTAFLNNQLLFKDWYNLNGIDGNLVRLRDNAINTSAWGNRSVDCVATVGDKYYVFDPTNSDAQFDKKVVVTQPYRTAPQVKGFVLDNAPSNGFYIVVRCFEQARAYGFVCAFVNNGLFLNGMRFASNLQSAANITSWDNGSFSCEMETGDVVHFIHVESES